MARVRTTKTAEQIRSEIAALKRKEEALKETLAKARFVEVKAQLLADEGKTLERLAAKYGVKNKAAALKLLAMAENVRVVIAELPPVKRVRKPKAAAAAE